MYTTLPKIWLQIGHTHIRKIPCGCYPFDIALHFIGVDLSQPIADLSRVVQLADKSAVGCDKSTPIGKEALQLKLAGSLCRVRIHHL